MNELISVIVPVYNVEKYVKTCVGSIINQTYQNIEIIIVDDGSTDSSGQICDDIAKSDCRISVYHKTNGGLSSARNYGMSKANGDFFAFVDSDDAVHKDFLSIMMETQHKTNADIVSVGISFFYNLKELNSLHQLKGEYNIKVFTGSEALIERFCPTNHVRCIDDVVCNKLFKKSFFSDIDFPEGRLHEDMFVTYKILDKSNIFVFIDAPYYFYFQSNNNSIMHNNNPKKFLDLYDSFSEEISYFGSLDIYEGAFLHFLITEYLSLLLQSRIYYDSYEVKIKRKSIAKWIRTHIWQDHRFSLLKKIVIILCTRHIWIYALFRKVKERKQATLD